MAVTPDGFAVSCMAVANNSKKVRISNIREIDDFVDGYMKKYSPFVNKICDFCIAKATCGGMCPAAVKLKNLTYDDNFCDATVFFLKSLLGLLFQINKEEIMKEINKQGFFIPSFDHRKKLYGNIFVDEKKRDFQYSPNW
jgi:radical SAM protein with 4Fe4S-binding SPASM domain